VGLQKRVRPQQGILKQGEDLESPRAAAPAPALALALALALVLAEAEAQVQIEVWPVEEVAPHEAPVALHKLGQNQGQERAVQIAWQQEEEEVVRPLVLLGPHHSRGLCAAMGQAEPEVAAA